MLALLQLVDRLLNGPAPPFTASLRDRIAYAMGKGIVIAAVLTVVLTIGLLAGAGEEIAELGGPWMFIQLYLGSCVGGAVLFYGLRPLHARFVGLVVSGVLAIAGVACFIIFFVGRRAGGAIPFAEHVGLALLAGVVPGIGLAFVQRRSDTRHGLVRPGA